jgi:hypothetical protein
VLRNQEDSVIAGSESSRLCPICSGERREVFQAVLLKKYQVRYFFCGSCGLLQTEEPFWLDEAYSSAIADADTGMAESRYRKKVGWASLFLFRSRSLLPGVCRRLWTTDSIDARQGVRFPLARSILQKYFRARV